MNNSGSEVTNRTKPKKNEVDKQSKKEAKKAAKEEQKPLREEPSKSPMGLLKTILVLLIALWVGIYYFRPQLFHNIPTAIPTARSKVNPYYNEIVLSTKYLQLLKQKAHYTDQEIDAFADVTLLVGYNTNIDLIVDAIAFLNRLELPNTREMVLDFLEIRSLRHLESTFSFYFALGAAAERHISDQELFAETQRIALENSKENYGGNAAIIAQIAAGLGADVYLAGAVGEKLKPKLHKNVKVVPSDFNDDEAHIIMEYNQNSKWYGVSPPRANRFIISRDISNSQLAHMDVLHDFLPKMEKRPDSILLSGLHLLTKEYQATRVDEMVRRIGEVPHSSVPSQFLDSKYNIPIHLELASVADVDYMRVLANKIIPNVDSLGLNEQELGFLYVSTGGSKYTLEDFVKPDINTAVEAIKHIFTEIILKDIQGFDENVLPERRLTSRIHFHYLTYHIIAIKSGYSEQWRSPKASIAAVAASVLEATHQACNFSNISFHIPENFQVDYHYTPGAKITIKFDESPVSSWEDLGIEFFIAPVPVCKNPTRTVGLGDAISTVSYLYQTFKPL
ncbi:glucokinase [Tieghemostelium lacteum]|uniref:Glucokinase n=1 Tax=Tieghemostelium lacteum TaxID=361077 RepID=A0A151Z5X6_TIELA|nr:glucokinase [Tieghemostelium lacteum]|eukprot:KYQ89360.1 glucokinase [Tieghemostelium lacteum]